MWKKTDSEMEHPSAPRTPAPAQTPASRPAARSQPALIGPSISIQGDISGQEDLVIEGRVKGAIQLGQHNVTVGQNGRVEADIHGKKICVDGEVKGDLFGEEVMVRKSGRVVGNATAPRVILENGCNFRGSIDMQPKKAEAGAKRQQSAAPPRARQVG